jgi:hypothetical protein
VAGWPSSSPVPDPRDAVGSKVRTTRPPATPTRVRVRWSRTDAATPDRRHPDDRHATAARVPSRTERQESDARESEREAEHRRDVDTLVMEDGREYDDDDHVAGRDGCGRAGSPARRSSIDSAGDARPGPIDGPGARRRWVDSPSTPATDDLCVRQRESSAPNAHPMGVSENRGGYCARPRPRTPNTRVILGASAVGRPNVAGSRSVRRTRIGGARRTAGVRSLRLFVRYR